MVWLYPLPAKDSKYVAEAMAMWLSLNGAPRAFYCDNGTEFMGDFDDFCENRYPAIPRIKGRAYHPESQGSVGRANKTFKKKLRTLRRERGGGGWARYLPELQLVINTCGSRMLPAHTTPFEVWYGRKPHWITTAQEELEE
jgi:hypothetical protein